MRPPREQRTVPSEQRTVSREQWIAPINLELSLTMDELLEDLCRPGRPPGRWDVPGREPAHVDALLREIERGARVRA